MIAASTRASRTRGRDALLPCCAALLVLAVTPAAGAPAAAPAKTAKPIPPAALEHPPTAAIAAVPTLPGVSRASDCELDDLRRGIDREVDAAIARQEADYGTAPAPAGPAGAARQKLLDQAAALTGDCLDALDMDTVMRRTVEPELDAMREDLRKVSEDFRNAFSDCPSDPEGGRNAACTRTLYARANVRGFGSINKHLQAADADFAEAVRRATACVDKRERLVKDGMATGVSGADVNTILAPLTRAWAVPPAVAKNYTTICRAVKEAIQSDIPKPR